jgi:hypothetical protein
MAGLRFCRNDAGKGQPVRKGRKKKKSHGQTLDLVSVKTTPEKASPSEKGEKKKESHGQTLDLVSVETTPEKASPPEKAGKKKKLASYPP